MDEINLYPYQMESIRQLRLGLRDGHQRQILCAPTGAGKTVMGTYLLSEVQRKQTRAAFVVDRVALCDQTSKMLWAYGIRHGVAQSTNTYGRTESIQVCSAQTIEKREYWPNIDLIIVDECHTMRRKILEFVQNIDAPVIGLTATPFSKGLGEVYSHIVNVTTTQKLIDSGYLAPLKVYIAKEIDMTGAKKVRGEWTDKEVEVRGKAIIGDIISEWQDKTEKHFGGPVKTIVFSATVAHGEEICRQFQAAGFNFLQVSYKDKNDETRAAIIEEFRKPDSSIDGLVSCEALAKGFDVPDILCGISARPYSKSFASHIQQIGRAMRAYPGKDYALWLDHAGNYLGFYDQMVDLFQNGVTDLDCGRMESVTRAERKKEDTEIACHGCGYAPLEGDECPSCGKVRVKKSTVEVRPGEMIELIDVDVKKHPHLENPGEVWRQLCQIALERKGDEVLAKKFALAQYRNFYQRWPGRNAEFDPAGYADLRLRSHVKANIIRWAKRRAA